MKEIREIEKGNEDCSSDKCSAGNGINECYERYLA